MKPTEIKGVVVSETRFAHFVRSAPPAERQRVFVKAIKAATEDQRKVLDEHFTKHVHGPKHCPA